MNLIDLIAFSFTPVLFLIFVSFVALDMNARKEAQLPYIKRALIIAIIPTAILVYFLYFGMKPYQLMRFKSFFWNNSVTFSAVLHRVFYIYLASFCWILFYICSKRVFTFNRNRYQIKKLSFMAFISLCMFCLVIAIVSGKIFLPIKF